MQISNPPSLLQALHECICIDLAAPGAFDLMTVKNDFPNCADLCVVDTALEELCQDVNTVSRVAGVEDETVLGERKEASLVVNVAASEQEPQRDFRTGLRVASSKT